MVIGHDNESATTRVLYWPVSTCSAERSFSSLRRLKSYLRSTSSRERLNHLAGISVHSGIVSHLNVDSLMDDFIKRAHIRIKSVRGTLALRDIGAVG